MPAQVVRHALDLVKENIDIYYLYDNTKLQSSMYDIFAYSVSVYGALILAMAIGKGVFLFLIRQTIIIMSRHIEYDLKNEIYQHYQKLPLSFYRKNSTGDLMARISEDVSYVRMYVGPSIMYLLNMVVLVVLVLSYMFSVNARLTWWVLVPMPILSVSIFFVSSIVNKRSEQIQRSLSSLSTFVQEAFSGIRVIKAFAREDDSSRRFVNESNNYKDKSLDLTKVDALFSPTIMFLIGLYWCLLADRNYQERDTRNITSSLYVFMSPGINRPQPSTAASRSLNVFVHTHIAEQQLKRKIIGDINFKDISFVYPDSGIEALKNVTFEIKSGQSLAILGTTGSGKSTIANLILRLYDPTSGSIEIDEVPIKAFDIQSLRSQIGYVPQDVFLFSDSILNNAKFGNPDLDDESVYQAMKDADLYDNVVDFEHKFETVLGERGITLSGGQKQRLSITRAISRSPTILLLDDSLSAVDTNTENKILNSLSKIMQDRTSIIISHRVSSAKLANSIIMLDEGRIVEQGTHAELYEQQGLITNCNEKQLNAEEA
jgi:ATP-binding cassette subfamily B protein